MTRWRAFVQLVLARFREFYREPEAVFWVYGFPLILAVVLGLAFKGGKPEPPIVDVRAEPDASRAEAVAKVLVDAGLDAAVQPDAACVQRLRQGKSALYLALAAAEITYHYDDKRPESLLARKWVDGVLARHAAGERVVAARDVLSEEPGSRYIDFLLPGLIGMNLMGGGLFGLGFILVDMRVRKLFKRLLATPMRRGDFLGALLASRLVFLVPEMTALLSVGGFLFGVPMQGSPLALAATILVAAVAFAGLGLLLGCRTEKTETISGYINLVMLPSYLLSGVFFKSSRFPEGTQPFIQAIPLTQVNDALREIMLEGAGLAEVAWRLGILAAWATVCFGLALRWFRWR